MIPTTSATPPINWVNAFFLTLAPLTGIIGSIFLCVSGRTQWSTVLLAVVFFLATGLSITAGYHRLCSHRTYKAAWPARLFFALVGAAAFQGSVFEWCTDHRNHHLYTDTDKDPYSIHKGFWFAHMGWLFRLDSSTRNYDNPKQILYY